MEETLPEHGNLFVSLISGGCAGISVEVSLFPLDTLKTRLQAEGGIWKSGGTTGNRLLERSSVGK